MKKVSNNSFRPFPLFPSIMTFRSPRFSRTPVTMIGPVSATEKKTQKVSIWCLLFSKVSAMMLLLRGKRDCLSATEVQIKES